MKKFISILVGLILLLLPLYDWITNSTGWNIGESALTVLKGSLVWIILILGAIMVFFGLSTLKE